MHSARSLSSSLLSRGISPSVVIAQLQIRKAIEGCSTVLDVGCGETSVLQHFGIENLIGIEGYAPSAAVARQGGCYSSVVQGDVRDLRKHFGNKSFDACVALDLIEHLPKAEGLKLLEDLEVIARKKVVILTPNGFLKQGHTLGDDLQVHQSGWESGEMSARGYKVAGALGPKYLRGEYHRLVKSPKAFWALVSLLGDILYTRRRPEKSAAILCVKNLEACLAGSSKIQN